MVFVPIKPVLIIKNISTADVNVLGVKIRPGQQKDIYKELEYNDGGSLTSTILKELESPNGKIYHLWKVLDVIRIIECVNPTYFGTGFNAESVAASNAYFEGAVLGYEGGSLKWLAAGAGGGISSVTATSPLISSGGASPNISIDESTASAGDVLTYDGSSWTPASPALNTPGGGVGDIQINDGLGNLAGSTDLTFSGLALDVTNTVRVTDGGNTLTIQSASIEADAATLSIDAGTTVQIGGTARVNIGGAFLLPDADGTVGSVLTTNGSGTVSWAATGSGIEYDQQLFVADGANPAIATGAPLRPFASISAALAAITDAAPSKRYLISVAAGEYTEASSLNLKPNVFIVGATQDAVRITAPSFALDSAFTGGADNRAGISNAVLTGACLFDFSTVTSTAGKLYFRNTVFASAISMIGYNNAIVQAQFSGCQLFGNFSVRGVNVGIFNDNIVYGNIILTQSTFGGVPTILTATGGACSGSLSATTTVTDFDRRISIFARSFWINGPITIDGASSYFDYTTDSVPAGGMSAVNSGNLIRIDGLSSVQVPITPRATTDYTNLGDWGRQWFTTFNYVNSSTGTDLYIGTVDSSYDFDAPGDANGSAGYSVYIQPDQYGLKSNINGGLLDLKTANVTGTGASGNIDISTGTAVNGSSGSITLATGATSGTGTRGNILCNAPQLDMQNNKLSNARIMSNVVSVSDSDLIVTNEDVVLINPSTNTVRSITLPTAAGNSGRTITIKKTDAFAAVHVISTTSGQTIDGVNSKTLSSQWQYIVVTSDGSNWMITG